MVLLPEQPYSPGTIRVYIVYRVAVGVDVRLPRYRLQGVVGEELLRLRVVVPPPHVQQPALTVGVLPCEPERSALPAGVYTGDDPGYE